MTPKSVRSLVLTLALPVLCSASPVAAGKSGGYLDFLNMQAVGELRTQRYDVYQGRGETERFLGNADVARGTFLGGGFGLRIAYVTKSGARFSGEGSGAGGRLVGAELPWASTSTATRVELLSSVGYQLATGPFVWHVAGVLGCDYLSFKVAQPGLGGIGASGSALGSTSAPAPALVSTVSDEIRLSRWGLRAGGQIGLHLQVSEMAAIYTDATFDYDGQWRARLGFAFGNPGRR